MDLGRQSYLMQRCFGLGSFQAHNAPSPEDLQKLKLVRIRDVGSQNPTHLCALWAPVAASGVEALLPSRSSLGPVTLT